MKGPDSQIGNAVLGGIDGCVTTFAIVSGALGAGLAAPVALILGVANLIADGFSMAASNYEAVAAEAERAASLRALEEEHIEFIPKGEREEIREIYRRKGFDGDLLESIVATITADREVWIQTMLREEHGLQGQSPNPAAAASTTFIAFVTVGAFPLLPYAVPGATVQNAFVWSAALAAAMFFLIGTLKSALLGLPPLRAGLRTLAIGSIAAALAYLVGYLLRQAGLG